MEETYCVNPFYRHYSFLQSQAWQQHSVPQVSIPSTGITHFYRYLKANGYRYELCQSLLQALLISTMTTLKSLRTANCVNPFYRHYSFLQRAKKKSIISTTVSIPSTGITHFYTFMAVLDGKMKFVVSIPSTGITHFYPLFWKPAIFKASQPLFCRYFSEYSEKGVFLEF